MGTFHTLGLQRPATLGPAKTRLHGMHEVEPHLELSGFVLRSKGRRRNGPCLHRVRARRFGESGAVHALTWAPKRRRAGGEEQGRSCKGTLSGAGALLALPASAVDVRGGCSVSRPRRNPPCRVAVDGLIDKFLSEGEVDESGGGVERVWREVRKKVSSKVPRNMDEMEWLLKKHTDCIQQVTSNILSHVHTRKICVCVTL